MQRDILNNVNVTSERVLVMPSVMKTALPLSPANAEFISNSRLTISNIIHKKDPRTLVIMGPCSIHDIAAAKEYALKLKALQETCLDTQFIVMRVYFEKPRTTVGWKGLINDPHLDGTFDIETGLNKARELMLWLTDQEIPVATEALDPISPQYLSDLVSWSAIGARTTESQTHREMASGLSMPVGFKNGTDGNVNIALNAIGAAGSGHNFLGINEQGQVTIMQTVGNPDAHLILRGGKQPNYQQEHVKSAADSLTKSGYNPAIIVDCSHANSYKDFNRQGEVARDVLGQIEQGDDSIVGIMIESHINAGNQKLDADLSKLKYGVSITDGCIDWQTTEELVLEYHQRLLAVVAKKETTHA
ncbi:3-deoxy-7-phosphoheptulonate synthase [Psychrosphaera sp. B3R10]|uniref:3-deoxy-7-phosphoheptulonate synthase n=1 Tax=unclassified Psychrosphaera TaxID=2641570 RepID=UPI001C09EFEC|nr:MULTISPECIES: 3-deoxy-7-phosphoheptulonate synthase [unclassified Psychrosphaera]MBU2880733.1 3-deoxy-7-phosphoheptulonate synthase [Psychrosphaera sp. I2R16]MBU2991521.1 3-deoxy-7-phosphoheptulonate synthase [Psychrosphaera sp. B3R10]MDO6719413.1 3-deoxy-7-phosphoheptulonate synthase [Psychrosphaera sp. 1_MG-2023]